MKKTWVIVSIFAFIAILVLGVVSWNALRVDRKFVILHNPKLNFCYIVDDGLQYQINNRSFTYRGYKNNGKVELLERGLAQDLQKVDINGFKSGYKKLKNFRIYEYQLNDSYVLRDTFEVIESMPLNLVPYRETCDKIKEQFKNHIEIFQGV